MGEFTERVSLRGYSRCVSHMLKVRGLKVHELLYLAILMAKPCTALLSVRDNQSDEQS